MSPLSLHTTAVLDSRGTAAHAADTCRLKQTDGTASKGTSLLRAWGEKDPLKKPSCALLVTLVQAMLHHADEVSVTAIVTSR